MQETKWARKGSREMKVNRSQLRYIEKVNGRNDVCIIVDEE